MSTSTCATHATQCRVQTFDQKQLCFAINQYHSSNSTSSPKHASLRTPANQPKYQATYIPICSLLLLAHHHSNLVNSMISGMQIQRGRPPCRVSWLARPNPASPCWCRSSTPVTRMHARPGRIHHPLAPRAQAAVADGDAAGNKQPGLLDKLKVCLGGSQGLFGLHISCVFSVPRVNPSHCNTQHTCITHTHVP